MIARAGPRDVLTYGGRAAPRPPREAPYVGFMGDKAVRVEFDDTVLKQVQSEVRTIKAEYLGRISDESIQMVADESLRRLADSRVPQYVALFVGRFTRQRIKELLAAEPSRN